MVCRCFRVLLVVVGGALLFFAVFPVLAFVHFQEPLQTELMGSKLLMMPVGAVCLLGASWLKEHESHR